MGYMLRFRGNGDVEDYKQAGKEAKRGIKMVMDAVERNDMQMAMEGASMAWNGVKTMCDISKEMEDQYGERRYDNMDTRGYGERYGNRYDRHEWNQRDDEMMERRMRDSRGRFM